MDTSHCPIDISRPVLAEFADTVMGTELDPIDSEAFPGVDTAAPVSTELSAITGVEELPEPLELGTGSGTTLGSSESRNVTDVEPAVKPVLAPAVAVTKHWPAVVKPKMPVVDVIAQSLVP
jgi:hypothetical protein